MNLLFVTIDDLFSLSSWPLYDGVVKTPNLDALAAQSVVFDEAFADVALCNPSRSAILTGQSPWQTQVIHNSQDLQSHIDLATETLPGILKSSGYYTAIGGKVFHYLDAANHDQVADYVLPSSGIRNVNGTDGIPPLDWGATDKVLSDDTVVEAATDLLLSGEAHDKLALFVGIYRPHADWVVPQEYIDLYDGVDIPVPDFVDASERAEFAEALKSSAFQEEVLDRGIWQELVKHYLASVSYADAKLGELLQSLAASPYASNTAVVVMSDHGYHLGDGDYWHKFTLFEQAARAPYMYYIPGNDAAVIDTPVNLSSAFATTLEILGEPIPDKVQASIANLVFGGAPSGDEIAVTWQYGNVSVRNDDYRFTKYADGSEELFRIDDDIYSENNLVDEQIGVAAALRSIAENVDAQLHLRPISTVFGSLEDDVYYLEGAKPPIVDPGGEDSVFVVGNYTLPDGIENLYGLYPSVYTSTLHGNNLDNSIDGTLTDNIIYGHGGDDQISGAAGDDKIYGGDGDDQLGGLRDDDVIDGGAGDDRIDGGFENDLIHGGTGNDTITGGAHDDEVHGDAGDDILSGLSGFNRLFGGSGDDRLVPGIGQDSLFGDAGIDTAVLSGHRSDYLLLSHDATATILRPAGGGGTIELRSVEFLEFSDQTITLGSFIVSAGRPTIGTAQDDTLIGGPQNDHFDARSGIDYVQGKDGDDIISGGVGNDTLVGGSGNDFLFGGAGQDEAFGGDGDDTFQFFDHSDEFFGGGGGVDLIEFHSSQSSGASVDFELGLVVGGVSAGSSFRGVENLIGTAYDDNVVGNNWANDFFGYDGDDQLLGMGGTDLLNGGRGDDLIVGGLDGDFLFGGAGDDQLNGQDGDDSILGGVGADFLIGGEGNDVLDGEAGHDRLNGNGGTDVIRGGRGNDLLRGEVGTDTLRGGDGNDTLKGGPGTDTLLGDAGTDQLYIDTLDLLVNGGEGYDFAYAESTNVPLTFDFTNAEIEWVYGSPFDDVLQTNGPDKIVIEAGGGDDFLVGGGGGDHLRGQAGNDLLFGRNGADILQGNIGDDFLKGEIGTDTLRGGEDHDVLRGGPGSDNLYGDAGSDRLYIETIDQIVRGGDGYDFAYAESQTARLNFNFTNTGIEWVYGSPLDDNLRTDGLEAIVIEAGGGDDFLVGGGGDDYLRGQAGNDLLFGKDGTDVLRGGNGNDFLKGEIGADTLRGGEDDDVLRGGPGSDNLYGDAGSDRLYIDTIDQIVRGGDGYDFAYAELSSARLTFDFTNTGIEWVYGSPLDDNLRTDGLEVIVIEAGGGDDFLVGGGGDDYLRGQSGNDTLFGKDGSDALRGGTGNDFLKGEAGDDLIVGGSGTDLLFGGAGSDRFIFSSLSDSKAGAQRDTIRDFEVGLDKLKLSGTGFTSYGGETDTFTMANQVILDGSTLKGSVDGVTSVFEIEIFGVFDLGANDFSF